MHEKKLFLGIDTSCYTTSLAVIADGEVKQLKKMLDVKMGECGLRQSDAHFQHVKNLPQLFGEMKKQINFKAYDDVIVTVSSRPRSVDGSYMPVFIAGQSFARVVADVLSAKYFEVSHQDGHIMAAIHSCGAYELLDEPFLTYHLSGGTTELLLTEWCGDGFKCTLVGGTRDLPAGQFVDRMGVKLGMSFPCGKYMDLAAIEYTGEKPKVKTCARDGYINFSGEETRYRRLTEDGKDSGEIAYCVMKCISESVKKSVLDAKKLHGAENVLMVGGVSSSKFMRNEFAEMNNTYFAAPELSTDNAVGVCKMGEFLLEK